MGSNIIIGTILRYRFLFILIEKHKDIWQEIGKPNYVFNFSMDKILMPFTYILKKKYAGLEDSDFVKLCNKLRFSYIVQLIVVPLFFITMLITVPWLANK